MNFAEQLTYWYARIFAKPQYIKLNRLLFTLGSKGLGLRNYQDLSITGELSFLKKYLIQRQNPIVFDVGANRGKYSLICQQLNPNSKIFCFEPHPQNFSFLKEQIKSSNIVVLNQALSEQPGKLFLYDYKNNNGSTHATLYENVIETLHGSESTAVEVEVSTIDTVIKNYNLDKIDLLKIDVEGHELKVLTGAKEAIQQGKIEAIQFEFTHINVISRVFMKDFIELLGENYNFYRLLPTGLLPLGQYNPITHEIFIYQNIICLKKDCN
ncbi:methyltransferase FkbM family [Stanieria cyanosphaera PCC 7437]|uniref:Methyltransferase FkbM family n=1 Tax=Stanieria cyanosphaera (strain ATCC 29371 / PCC 7437) TaxID=111780 RepID=K9XP78_STAC7|nr:FkbM family methyltransferase [Stanieria cyanosphaera]AFZ33851.1 methyltransferase FkbM family [Stanieria cyanosphaera PCC 7437]